MFAINVVVVKSTSSLLNRCRFQNKSISNFNILIKLDQMFANKNSANAFARIIEYQHIIAKMFSLSMFSIEYIQLFFYLFIVSTNRAFFCSVSHRVSQILMKRRQKTKNSFFVFLRNFAKHFISIMHFFVLFFIEFFRFWRDIDNKRKIIYSNIQTIIVVIVTTIKLVSIWKWSRLYKSFSNFFFHIFFLIIIFEIVLKNKFFKNVIKRRRH